MTSRQIQDACFGGRTLKIFAFVANMLLSFALQLLPGKAQYIQALGKHFAVFRGQESGKAFVTDAYCPHLGANLAATPSTQVKGDCIECPFHKWKFDGNDGSCTEIPYSTKVS